MVKYVKRRIAAGILALSLLLGTESFATLAENVADPLCPHHTEHNTDCGYQEGTPGSCRFVCTECAEESSDNEDASDETAEDVTTNEEKNNEEQTDENQPGSNTSEENKAEDNTAEDHTKEENTTEATEAAEVADLQARDASTPAWQISDAKTPESWTTDYTVQGISPSNATINLFDYWLYAQDAVDSTTHFTNRQSGGNVANWNRSSFLPEGSINRIGNVIHPFLFAGIGPNNSWRFGGEYNTYTWGSNPYSSDTGTQTARSNIAYTGIVQSMLDKTGFPKLNLTDAQIADTFKTDVEWYDRVVAGKDENGNNIYEYKPSVDLKKAALALPEETDIGDKNESLAYIFDPDVSHSGKASYTDVEGLMQYKKATVNANGTVQSSSGYYYDSSQNFAEFYQTGTEDNPENRIRLYNQANRLNGKYGQFFPFNAAADVFDEVTADDQTKTLNAKSITYQNWVINHYLGLTLEVDFYQPDGGQIATEYETTAGDTIYEDMIFDFRGDDDVWVFVDGVLVADLGGIHDMQTFQINFKTGKITYGETGNKKNNSSLREQFLKAIRENNGSITDTNGNVITEKNINQFFRTTDGEAGTFRSGTEHTLKFFYLERGNQESNLKLSYNLIPPISDEIVKVDQDNNPVEGATFELYAAKAAGSGDEDTVSDGEKQYTIAAEEPITTFTTGADGSWEMKDELGIPYDFKELYNEGEGITHYIVKEVSTPEGYRTVPDILLKYSSAYHILEVANTWDTGAVGNFTAKLYQNDDNLEYENAEKGTISEEDAKAGIVVAIPMAKVGEGDSSEVQNWRPIYGANLVGYAAAEADQLSDGSSTDETLLMRKRMLKAALYQIHASKTDSGTYQSWHLFWSEEEQRYQGTLQDLPGVPERYYHLTENPSSDLYMAYYYIDAGIFKDLKPESGETEISDEQKLSYLEALVSGILGDSAQEEDHTSQEYLQKLDDAIDQVADELLNSSGQIKSDGFNRLYGSYIYIPNILNTLTVEKVDQDGKPLSGATFGLYESENAEQPLATGVTDENGRIVFSATADSSKDGQVRFALKEGTQTSPGYYLKEISAPQGYKPDTSCVPIYVTNKGVYANALKKDDNISVLNSLGTLVGTMRRYASDDTVNATLCDLQLTGSGNTLTAGGETDLLVHYGLGTSTIDGMNYGNYGVHEYDTEGNKIDEEKIVPPVFVTEEGAASGMVYQNFAAHNAEKDPYNTTAHKENLGDKELSHLFTGNTIVVVKNEPYTYELNVVKLANDEETVSPLQGAEFELKEKNAETAISFVKESDGVYRKAGSADKTESKTTTLATGSGGTLKLSGLAAGEYILTETKAPSGYKLPAKNQISIKLLDTSIETAEGPDPGFLLGTDGKLDSGSGAEGTFVYEDDTYKTEISGNKLTVHLINQKGYTLPDTGGTGTISFSIGGILLLAAAVLMLRTVTGKKVRMRD